jgi:hypothetical protein
MKNIIKPRSITTCLILACLIFFTHGCKKEYTLKVNAVPAIGGNIDLSPAGGNYEEGTTVNITAIPNMGYFFNEWSGDETGTYNPVSIKMDSDKKIDANFVEGISENFDDGIADFFMDDGTGRWGVYNYAYMMEGTFLNINAYTFYPYSFSDFELSFDLKAVNCDGGWAYGIFLRSQSGDYSLNSYRLCISKNGEWYFGIYTNGTFSFITDGWISSNSLLTGLNVTNNIRIVFTGSEVTIYFNNVYQGYAYGLTLFNSGYIGLLAFDTNQSFNRFSFDNLMVTTNITDSKSLPENFINNIDITSIKGVQGDPNGLKAD